MKTLFAITLLVSIFSNPAMAERKQRPFNDEGPICKENCGSKEDRTINLEVLISENTPKPPFNDEGPGGNNG
jgi:hypothetical protein